MDNYKQILEKLKSRTPFRGTSLSGFSDGKGYLVYSYTTCIAIWSFKLDSPMFTPLKYSATTSRHQNLVRKAWEL